MQKTKFTVEKISQTQVNIYYVFGRGTEYIYFVKQPNYPTFNLGKTVSFSIRTTGDLNRSDYLLEQLFVTKQWTKINFTSNAIYDGEFQKEVDIALNIVRITLPNL